MSREDTLQIIYSMVFNPQKLLDVRETIELAYSRGYDDKAKELEGGKNRMVQVKGMSISGEHIKTLEDKSFFVISKPTYIEKDDLNHPGEKVEVLMMKVKLADGSEMEYYPNKTSRKAMVNLYGTELDNCVSHKFVWKVAEEKGFGKDLLVLYVQPEKLDEVAESDNKLEQAE